MPTLTVPPDLVCRGRIGRPFIPSKTCVRCARPAPSPSERTLPPTYKGVPVPMCGPCYAFLNRRLFSEYARERYVEILVEGGPLDIWNATDETRTHRRFTTKQTLRALRKERYAASSGAP